MEEAKLELEYEITVYHPDHGPERFFSFHPLQWAFAL